MPDKMFSEIYIKMFEEYQKRLEVHAPDLFPFVPLNFMQKKQLSMLAASIADDLFSATPQKNMDES